MQKLFCVNKSLCERENGIMPWRIFKSTSTDTRNKNVNNIRLI